MANLGSLLLAMSGLEIGLTIAVALLVVGVVAAVFLTRSILTKRAKKRSEQKLDETSRRVEEMLSEARAEGKRIKKESILEAKEQELKRRNEFEQEMKEKRAKDLEQKALLEQLKGKENITKIGTAQKKTILTEFQVRL